MIIGIDTRELKKNKAGKGWYVFNVLREILHTDKNNEYVLYGDQKTEFPEAPNVKKIIIEGSEIFWHIKVARRLKKDGIQLYWAPTSPIVPALTNIPTIITIHDLTTLLFPDKHLKKSRLIDKIFLKRALLKTKKIISDSRSTKKDLIKLFPFSKNKIFITYLGYDQAFKELPNPEVKDKLSKYSLKPGYLLFVGTLEPRKNVTGIINAYAKLDQQTQEKHPLVLVGKKGWYFEPIIKEINNLALKNSVKILDYVPFEDLPSLYNGASVFIYPSFYEGFGLPPLEAMACGKPVITSNISSLPEVVGDAAVLVDPLNLEQISAAIDQVLKDPKKKLSMGKNSAKQAKLFSWERCGKETLQLLKSVSK